MFSKLRVRLTLINVVVVSVIALFFLAGIYVQMLRSLANQTDQLMRLVANDAGSNIKIAITRRNRHPYSYFYVKVDNQGKITETSSDLPINLNQVRFLTQKALGTSRDNGGVYLHDEEEYYRFIKAPLNNGRGSTLVFVNTEAEDEVIGHLLAAFSMTGLGGIALTLFGSLFMAHRAIIPIRNSWEKQKNFVADASHELRTPLAVIQTNLDIVKSNPDQTVASQATWLENIQAESSLMAKLVGDLLFLARADSQQVLINPESFHLSDALRETLRPFEPVARQKDIRLSANIEPDVDFIGDPTRLRQLVAILVDNAIKYTPAGGDVTLVMNSLAGGIQIMVTDTGEGIENEHLDKIFERFYRVDKARSRESGGTGLGLAIAEWIVKGHRGTIRVNSTPEKGTTFLINLPRRKFTIA